MLISHSRRFIFIHIYKTAGRSVTKALRPFAHQSFRKSGRRDQLRLLTGRYPWVFSDHVKMHATAIELRELLPPRVFGEYFKFAFVRDPWDWHVSLYSFIREKQSHEQHEMVSRMSFGEFIEWRVENEPVLQKEMLCDEEGNLLVDFVGRFDRLRSDFEAVCRRIGVQCPLPHVNASSRGSLDQYYDPRATALIMDACRTDIEFFGFDVPRTSGNQRFAAPGREA